MNDNSVAESLSNMQKDGQISENDLAEVTKRLAVGEELKETFVSTEEPESNSDLPSSNKKKEKLSSKIAKSKAKTRRCLKQREYKTLRSSMRLSRNIQPLCFLNL